MVATCDAHYPCREDADAHEALLAIQTRDVLSNPKRFKFDTKEFYLKTGAEMAAALPDFLDALPVSLEIAERCDGARAAAGRPQAAALPGARRARPPSIVPGAPLPRGHGPPLPAAARRAEAEERLRFELGVIDEMGFASYFLIVWDYMRWARENGVGVGPGRGSAAGSLVAYALRIVDLDPLAHGLLFERFLNPGRKSMPDIDTDFSVAGRDRVVQLRHREVRHRRGGAHRHLRQAARPRRGARRRAACSGHTYGQVDRIAKLVPERPDRHQAGRRDEAGHRARPGLRPTTRSPSRSSTPPCPLEGLVRNEGVHAAGVVIAPGDITDYLPVRLDDEGNVVTQVPDHDVEALGLLKMDFLGLRNLDVIEGCARRSSRSAGASGSTSRPSPLDDPATYADARPRRRDRRLPVRVERHARGAARGAAPPSSPT